MLLLKKNTLEGTINSNKIYLLPHLNNKKINYFLLKNIQIMFLKKNNLSKKLYNFFLYNKNFKLNINTYYYNNTPFNKNNLYLFNVYYRYLFIDTIGQLYKNTFKVREGFIEAIYNRNNSLKTSKVPFNDKTFITLNSQIKFKKNIITIDNNLLDILILYKLFKKAKSANIKRNKKEANKRVRFKKIANKLFKHRFREEPKKAKIELLPKKKKRKITIPVYTKYIKPFIGNPYYKQKPKVTVNDLIQSWKGHNKLFLILNSVVHKTKILGKKKKGIIDIKDYDYWITKFNHFKYAIFSNNILNKELPKELYKLNKDLKINKINGFYEKKKDNNKVFIKKKTSYILLKYPFLNYTNKKYRLKKKFVLYYKKTLKAAKSSAKLLKLKKDKGLKNKSNFGEKKLDHRSLFINVLKKFSTNYNDKLHLINRNKLSLVKQPKINSLVFDKPTSNLSLFLTKKNINLLSLFKQYLNKNKKYIKYIVKKKSIFKFLKFNKKNFLISKNINWSMFLRLNFLSKKISKLNNTNNSLITVPNYFISDYGIKLIKTYNSVSNLSTTNHFLENNKKINIRTVNFNVLKKKFNNITKNSLHIKKITYYNNFLYNLLNPFLIKKNLTKIYNLNSNSYIGSTTHTKLNLNKYTNFDIISFIKIINLFSKTLLSSDKKAILNKLFPKDRNLKKINKVNIDSFWLHKVWSLHILPYNTVLNNILKINYINLKIKKQHKVIFIENFYNELYWVDKFLLNSNYTKRTVMMSWSLFLITKDLKYIITIIYKILMNTSFKKHKYVLTKLRYIFEFFSDYLKSQFLVNGILFTIKGKIGKTGSVRKKKFTYRGGGGIPNSRKNIKASSKSFLVYTGTGVLGCSLKISFF